MARYHALVLDVGTTGIKAFVFDEHLNVVNKAYQKTEEIKIHSGHVEQDPRAIVKSSEHVLKAVVNESGLKKEDFVGLGITNQRETTIAWDKKTSWPFYPAIVWKDLRTQDYCDSLLSENGEFVSSRTGLKIQPYFSASKMKWLFDNIPEVRLAVEKECLGMGTVDSWLLWSLTEDEQYQTDMTNAARTMLFNIRNKEWDKDLFRMFGLDKVNLPKVSQSKGSFGNLKKDILGFSLPIGVVCGDQQASLYAAGSADGTTKITYGTGTFVMQITGDTFFESDDFFTTLSVDGKYTLEAKVDRGAQDVDKLLDDPVALKDYLTKTAKEVDLCLKKLPRKPEKIVIDGGVMRDGIIGAIQEEISAVAIIEQKIFDGTALGVAKLLLKDNK